MNKFEEIDSKRKESNARFEKLNSRVYKLFLEMGDATFCDGALSKKTKELIAIAIGVVKNTLIIIENKNLTFHFLYFSSIDKVLSV